jgi:hypothetical protein
MFVLEVITQDHTDYYEFDDYKQAINYGQAVYNRLGRVEDVKVYPKIS